MTSTHTTERFVRVVAALFVIWCVASPGVAEAQGSVVLTPSQKQLNENGVAAMVAGDFESAVLRFESSLALGPANIIYLNLGRAYARSGNCRKAVEAFDHVEKAPAVALPDSGEVAKVLARFRSELAPELCPAAVTLVCSPDDMKVAVDDAEPVSCSNAALQLAPGKHRVVGTSGGLSVAESFSVSPLEILELPLTLEVAAKAIPKPEPDGPNATRIWGWSLVGTGALAVTTALIIDRTVLKDDVEAWNDGRTEHTSQAKSDLEAMQRLNLGFFIGGGILAAVGGSLIAADLISDDQPESTARVLIAPDCVGVTLSW